MQQELDLYNRLLPRRNRLQAALLLKVDDTRLREELEAWQDLRGDSILAEFLGLDPHTVARGRQQLLDQNISSGRTRRSGGGRKPVEKKPPTSSH